MYAHLSDAMMVWWWLLPHMALCGEAARMDQTSAGSGIHSSVATAEGPLMHMARKIKIGSLALEWRALANRRIWEGNAECRLRSLLATQYRQGSEGYSVHMDVSRYWPYQPSWNMPKAGKTAGSYWFCSNVWQYRTGGLFKFILWIFYVIAVK